MTDIPGQPLFHSLRIAQKDPAAVPEARRLLPSVVRAWNLPLADTTHDDLELLSSEVITNAVCHTTGPCSVTVRWTGSDEGDIDVGDEFDEPAPQDETETTGSDDDRD